MTGHTKKRCQYSIILLLTVFFKTDNVLASYPNWMVSSTDTTTGIVNLNEYIDLFLDCLVHIINYSGGDFYPLTSPVVMHRYFLTVRRSSTKSNSNDAFYWYFTPIKPQKLYDDRNNSTDSPGEFLLYKPILSSYHNQRYSCGVKFYLYPPEHFIEVNPAKKTFTNSSLFQPPSLKYFFKYLEFIDCNIFRRLNGNYHILIQRKGYNFSRWLHEMDEVSTWELQLRSVILTTEGASGAVKYDPKDNTDIESANSYTGNSEPQPDHRIVSIEVLCQRCQRFYRATLPFSEPLTRNNLDAKITLISRINNEVSWYAHKLNDEVDEFTASGQRSMVEGLKVGKLNFRNLHDYSQGKLAGRLVADYLETNGFSYMTQRSSVETVMLFLAVPNITVEAFGWCDVDSRCDRTYFSLPEVMVFNQLNIRTVFTGTKEPLAFFTCGWQDQEGISFWGYFSAFDSSTWVCILVFCLAGGPIIAVVCKLTGKNFKALDMIIMGIKAMVEQGDPFAGNESKLRFVYWISGSWILVAVVLTNAYKGKNITELTSPLRSIGLQNASQLVDLNFTILTPIFEAFTGEDEDRKVEYVNCLYSVNGSELCKVPRGVYQHFIFYNIDALTTYLDDKELDFFTKTLYSKVCLIEEYLYPLQDLLVKDERFRNCSKIALLGWSNQIEHLAQKLYLKLPQVRHLSLVKDERIWRQSSWLIYNWEDERIIWRLRYLIHSGIADEWRRIDERGAKTYLRLKFKYTAAVERARAEKYPKSLSLKDNTLSLFVLFLLCITLSIISGMVELRYLLLLAMKYVYRGLVKGLKL